MESNVNMQFNLLDANLDNITDDLGDTDNSVPPPLPLPSARVTPEDEYDDDDIWGGEGDTDDDDIWGGEGDTDDDEEEY